MQKSRSPEGRLWPLIKKQKQTSFVFLQSSENPFCSTLDILGQYFKLFITTNPKSIFDYCCGPGCIFWCVFFSFWKKHWNNLSKRDQINFQIFFFTHLDIICNYWITCICRVFLWLVDWSNIQLSQKKKRKNPHTHHFHCWLAQWFPSS